MKIAIIDTGLNAAPPAPARAFLPKLLTGLTGHGDEVHLIEKEPPAENVVWRLEVKNERLHRSELSAAVSAEDAAPVLIKRLNELQPDIYLIWTSEDVGWAVLPFLHPGIATLAVGHADTETYYAPTRHYRSFLTRVIGVTPEVCVGFVLSCVIDKERVEWISYDELAGSTAETADAEVQKVIETYWLCFEKAIADARAAPRETPADFPPLKTSRPENESWFSKLKAKIIK
jgi:hypothetical protein